jgi:hypothetical protein
LLLRWNWRATSDKDNEGQTVVHSFVEIAEIELLLHLKRRCCAARGAATVLLSCLSYETYFTSFFFSFFSSPRCCQATVSVPTGPTFLETKDCVAHCQFKMRDSRTMLLWKLIGALSLLLSSLAGVVLPVVLTRLLQQRPAQGKNGSGFDASAPKLSPTVEVSATTTTSMTAPPVRGGNAAHDGRLGVFHWRKRWLNWINCVSAGLLIGVGLFHFLAECIEGAVQWTSQKASLTSNQGSSIAPAAIHDALEVSIGWFIAGLLVPLFVNKVVLTALKAHNDKVSVVPQAKQARELTPAHGSDGLTTNAADAPAERGVNEAPSIESKPCDVRSSSDTSASPSESRRNYIKTFMLAVLMALHSLTEGASLGLEGSLSSLTVGMIPMILHKFCDGIVVGVRVGKGLESEAAPSSQSAISKCEIVRGSIRRVPLVAVAWTAITPIVMIAAALGTSGSSNNNDHRPDGSLQPHTGPSDSPGLLTVAVQGMGAGSFIYLALAELVAEEFLMETGLVDSSPPGMDNEPRTPRIETSWLLIERFRQFLFLIAGVLLVVILEAESHAHE